MYYPSRALYFAIILFFIAPLTLPAQTTVDNFIRSTIFMDIDTASYYEMRSWLSRLDLSTEGDTNALRKRLRSYYLDLYPGLERRKTSQSAEESGSKAEEKNKLSIEEAGTLEFSSSEADDTEIRMRGGVVIRMVDSETGAVHRVTSNSLVFNREERLMVAEGDVSYVLEEGDRREKFTGRAITFQVENYHGVFIGGMSRKGRTVEGEKLSFYFKGDVITRPAKDRVFLEEGIISSSTLEDPYYRIASKNVWVLGPDEWALSDALIYLGRIPVFYIPFFFHPGDDILFHPSFGYKSVEGYYFQTSTYLLGRKETEGRNENSLSFLQVVEEDTSMYEHKRRGLFLRQTREKRKDSWVRQSGSYAKVLFDYYSRLGLFTGLEANIKNKGNIDSLSAKTGVGLMNYIFPQQTYNSYTTYRFDQSKGKYRRFSYEPWFLGSSVPFRFAFDIDMNTKWNGAHWRLALPIYSDPYFHNLFEGRNEEILWGSLLRGEELGGDTTSGSTGSAMRNPVLSSRFRFTASFPSEVRLIDSITLEKLDSEFAFNNAEVDEENYDFDGTPVDPLGFYYPEFFTPIDLAFTLEGSLLTEKNGYSDSSGGANGTEKTEGLRPPWAQEEVEQIQDDGKNEGREEEKGESEKERFRGKIVYSDLQRYRRSEPQLFSQNLDYTLSPDFSYRSRFSDEQRNDPSSVDLRPKYSYIDTSISGGLKYDSKLYGRYLHMQNNINLNGRYKQHYSEASDVDLDEYRLQDKRFSGFSAFNKFSLTSYFLDEYEEYDSSLLRYTFDSRFYRYAYDENRESYTSRMAPFQEEFIRTHSYALNLTRKEEENTYGYYFEGDLPPNDLDTVTGVSMKTPFIEGEVSFRFNPSEEERKEEYGPLHASAKIPLWEQSYLLQEFHTMRPNEDDYTHSDLRFSFIEGNVALQQTYDWNSEALRSMKALSSVDLWFFSAELEYRYTHDFTYSEEKGWVQEERKRFQPYKISSGIDFSYEPDPLWKNRIRLDAGLNTNLRMDMQKYTNTVLGIKLDLNAHIAEFFDLSFSLNSENKEFYSYIPRYAEQSKNIEHKNLWTDFMRSLNIFNREDLRATSFNLQSLSVEAVHLMHDWQLSLSYNGKPKLNRSKKVYEWRSEFSIMVQWKPIPEVRREIEYEDKEYSF